MKRVSRTDEPLQCDTRAFHFTFYEVSQQEYGTKINDHVPLTQAKFIFKVFSRYKMRIVGTALQFKMPLH